MGTDGEVFLIRAAGKLQVYGLFGYNSFGFLVNKNGGEGGGEG